MRARLMARVWVLVALPGAVLHADAPPPLSITFMARATYARAGGDADPHAPGGYARSDNLPRPATKLAAILQDLSPGAVHLVALPSSPREQDGHAAMGLLLVNRSDAAEVLDAQDSMLPVVQEAQDAQGAWRPIEYTPSSWCGNSYHHVTLPPGSYWDFTAPRYSGPVRTQLRFVLKRGDRPALISNAFEGAIHPDQFDHGKKQGHSPGNLMDPYNE